MRVEYEYTIDHEKIGRVTDRFVLLRDLPEQTGIYETSQGHIGAQWDETDIGLRCVSLTIDEYPPLRSHSSERDLTIVFQKNGQGSHPGGLRFYLDDSENMPQATVQEKIVTAMRMVPLGDPAPQNVSAESTELSTHDPVRNIPLPQTFSSSTRKPGGEKPFAFRSKGSLGWAAVPGERTSTPVEIPFEEMADDYIEKQFLKKGGE